MTTKSTGGATGNDGGAVAALVAIVVCLLAVLAAALAVAHRRRKARGEAAAPLQNYVDRTTGRGGVEMHSIHSYEVPGGGGGYDDDYLSVGVAEITDYSEGMYDMAGNVCGGGNVYDGVYDNTLC